MSEIDLRQGDCLERMKEIPDGSVDLTVTSPPYDNLRTYNGNNELWNEQVWKNVITELYRVTKNGGVVVWVVGDATIKGSETGTSFKQALYFKEIGFNLHDTMIWNKPNSGSIGSLNRYEQTMEYMFVFSKGKPKTTNLIMDKPNKRAGEKQHGSIRQPNGNTIKTSNYGKKNVNEYGRRKNVWLIPAVMGSDRCGHPAPFPIQLANDHITTWSNEQDVILDPFMGSGTTGVACVNTNRNFIGIELDEKYFEIAKKRIKEEL